MCKFIFDCSFLFNPRIHFVVFFCRCVILVNKLLYHLGEMYVRVRRHFEDLQCTSADCEKIEKQTRGQNKNESWVEMRQGLITSSNFGLVVKRQETTPQKVL